jgi:hypothetical protein
MSRLLLWIAGVIAVLLALAKQGAVAAVLGAVATPVAAVLAFVDPGLAKNADCTGLTSEAGGKVAQPQQ